MDYNKAWMSQVRLNRLLAMCRTDQERAEIRSRAYVYPPSTWNRPEVMFDLDRCADEFMRLLADDDLRREWERSWWWSLATGGFRLNRRAGRMYASTWSGPPEKVSWDGKHDPVEDMRHWRETMRLDEGLPPPPEPWNRVSRGVWTAPMGTPAPQ